MNPAAGECHQMEAERVVELLQTDANRGLSEREASERLERFGPNELPKEKKGSAIVAFLLQFHSRLTYILFAAAALSVFAGEISDAIGILLAVLIDAVFGFWQERKAENALEKLSDMVVLEATVLRDGRMHRVSSSSIVPGDVVLLDEGDRVPADGRIISSKDLRTDESSLTGESSAVKKSPEAVPLSTGRADRTDMAWMGTTVVAGTSRIVVSATGTSTAFGSIATSLQKIEEQRAPLEVRIDSLGQRLGIISVVLAAIVFVFGALNGTPLLEMFFFAVALVVSVIPEGLPAVLAVVLAIGVKRMAKRNAIIRHVPSVETLGVADVICTDKTGTLTENKMTVREVYADGRSFGVTGEGWLPEGGFELGDKSIRPAEHETLNLLVKVATVCNRATLVEKEGRHSVIGDPTEGALVVLGAKAGMDKSSLMQEFRLLDEIPFSSSRMYRAMLVESTDLEGRPERHVIAVGAYEVLSGRSEHAATDGKRRTFTEVESDFVAANDRMAGETKRVIAVAHRPAATGQETLSDADVSDLTMLGLIGMIDPPRKGVAEAVADCQRAGVRIIMVTGDHLRTAEAVARKVGILPEGECDWRYCGVHTDSDIATISDDELDAVLEGAAVFARVSPANKLRIVERLQAAGHTVAMTGDGVNDAPALKQAAIGVSMGISGTDVSKEVSDMVLADDNFVSIVNAIEEGRIIFRNVKQTVAYLFMTNIGEVFTVLASMALGLPLPLLPAQILWMNLVTDGFPDVALATEGRRGHVFDEPPRDRKEPILTGEIYALTVVTSGLMCVGTLLLFSWSLKVDGLDYARTVAFTTMAVFQLWNVFNMRSMRESIFRIGFFSNMYVFWSVVVSLLLQVAVLYWSPLQRVFRTVPLSASDWCCIALFTSTVLFAVEGYKWLIRRDLLPKAWER